MALPTGPIAALPGSENKAFNLCQSSYLCYEPTYITIIYVV